MISIIIPSLNSPHIKDIIRIIKRECASFKDAEIIVIGKDAPGLLAGERDIIFVDTGAQVSPARARNIGIELARGEIIIFLDSDCLPQGGWLRHLINAHQGGKDVVGGAVNFEDGNFWRLVDNISHFYNYHPSRRGDIVRDGPLPTANLSISRNAVDKAGRFSESLITGEDFEYSMKLRLKGYILNFERRASVLHMSGRTSLAKVLRHSETWAKNSIHIRKRFSRLLNTPFFMKSGILLYLASPLVAALASAKIFFTSPALLRYWRTIPVIYLAKLVWSIRASEELFNAG